MRHIRINAFEKGLVFRNNRLLRVLSEGTHWIMPGCHLEVHAVHQPLRSDYLPHVLLANEVLKDAVVLKEITATELLLVFQDQLLNQVLGAGKHLFWNEALSLSFMQFDTENTEAITQLSPALLKHKLLQPYVRTLVIEPFEQALLYVNGELSQVLAAGTRYFWNNSSQLLLQRTDMRVKQLELSGQEILTRDKAALRLNVQAQYKVNNITLALAGNKDHEKQLYSLVQLAVRKQVGSLSLDELLDRRVLNSNTVLEEIASEAQLLGLEVLSCGIRDIVLPGDMKDILNQVLLAEKKAQANVIMRREETASTRSLLNTAKLMEENAMLFKLKEMEYMERIAERVNSISVSGGTQVAEQLRQLFGSK